MANRPGRKIAAPKSASRNSALFSAQRFDRELAAHQRFADQDGVHPARLHAMDILNCANSTFANQYNFVWNSFAEFFRDTKIDMKRREIAIVDADDAHPCPTRDPAHQAC